MTEMETFLTTRGYPIDEFERWPSGIMTRITLRDEVICKFGFAILTSGVVEKLRPFSPILEIGAGSGYWSYELKKVGIDVIATDSGTGKYRFDKGDLNGGKWKFWTEIDRITALDAIAKYPNRSLLTVWPDYDDPWAACALESYSGDTVIYVGEGTGGCTGDERFHSLLDTCFPRQTIVNIPQHFGIHDVVHICTRK